VLVALIAIPLSLGIAVASGAPPSAGIIAAVVGGLVVGTLSGSALMVTGPAAGLTAVTLAGIAQLGDFRTFLLAVVLAGVIQLALAAVRAGVIGYYFPSAVINGMIAAIGLLLVLKQIPHALGYDADAMGDDAFRQANAENTFSSLVEAVRHLERGAVVVSVLSLAVLVAWRRVPRLAASPVPAALAVVVLAVAANALFAAVAPGFAIGAAHLLDVPVPESAGALLASVRLPDLAAVTDGAVWRVALLLAVVASLEALLALEATDKMDPYKREAPTDRELLAQGSGNIVSGLLGGLPVTGVIVRSAANIEGGAVSRRATILHGALLVVAVPLIPRALGLIPLAALAAILIDVGLRLAGPAVARREWALGKTHAIPYTVDRRGDPADGPAPGHSDRPRRGRVRDPARPVGEPALHRGEPEGGGAEAGCNCTTT
jgi:MFS superfamily sulfate permease-like transporter